MKYLFPLLSVLSWKAGHRDFPGGLVVKNSSCIAGNEGSIPGRGTKIPHVPGKLGPLAEAIELTCCN